MLHEYLQYLHQKTYYNHCFYESYSIVRIFILKKIRSPRIFKYWNPNYTASIIETKITEQVENSVAGIEGLDNIKSKSKDGLSNVKLVFSIDRNLDNCSLSSQQNIQPPSLWCKSSGNLPMTWMEIPNYLNRYLLDKFSILEGVHL